MQRAAGRHVHRRPARTTPAATGADTVAIGVFDGEDVAHDLPAASSQALVDAGEAKASFRNLALTHADGERWLLVGLGKRDELRRRARPGRRRRGARPRRASSARAGAVLGAARTTSATTLAGALVEGTMLAAYRFDRFKSNAGDEDGAAIERADRLRPPRRRRRPSRAAA